MNFTLESSTSKVDRRSRVLLELSKLETALYATPLQCQPGSLLVSFDVEFDSASNKIDEVGIAALLNTTLLESSVVDDASETPVASLLFLPRRRWVGRNTYTRQYLYGTAQSIIGVDLSELLPAILTPIDNHQVILVGHGIKSDILAIKKYCGLDLKSLPSIKMIIDTSYMPSIVLHQQAVLSQPGIRTAASRHKRISLKKACRLVGIPAKQLHNAGNDAYYTLKLLLLLFHSYKQQEIELNATLTDEARACWKARLERLQWIGSHNTHSRRPPKRIRDLKARDLARLNNDDEDMLDLAATGIFDDIQP